MLLCLGVFCTIYAPITAFGFPVDQPVLIILCVAGVLAAGVGSTFWGAKGLLPGLLAAGLSLFFVFPAVLAGAQAVLAVLTTELSAYGSIPVCFPGAAATPREFALFFGALGIFLGFALSLALSARSSTLLALLFTLPIAGAAFSIVVIPPAAWCAVGLLGFYFILLLRGALAPEPRRRTHMVWPALALAGLVFGAAFLIAPPERYTPEGWSIPMLAGVRERVPYLKPLLDRFTGAPLSALPVNIWYYNTAKVTIADAGARTIRNQRILSITTEETGTYYLRGHSMAVFDGRGWLGSEAFYSALSGAVARRPAAYLAALAAASSNDSQPMLTMSVTNVTDMSGILYLPYYTDFDGITVGDAPGRPVWEGDSYLSSTAGKYSAPFYHPDDNLLSLIDPSAGDDSDVEAYSAYAQMLYTQISEETARGLRTLAAEAGIEADANRQTLAAEVAAYVMSAARYTLRPIPVPGGEDFALYFLTESKQGYCIHFATAATLMLRALGVPARFTSGFLVTVPRRLEGREAPVTDANAHAWVEVYYDGLGWVPLEVTPPYRSTAGTASAYVPPEDDPVPDVSPRPTPSSNTPAATQATPGEMTEGAEWYRAGMTAALFGLLGAALLAVLARLGRNLTRKRRADRLAESDTNAAVLYAWRYIRRLLGPRGSPPEEIESLVFKARFSLHVLSEEERAAVVDYAAALAQKLDGGRGFFKKLWFRYIRRLY